MTRANSSVACPSLLCSRLPFNEDPHWPGSPFSLRTGHDSRLAQLQRVQSDDPAKQRSKSYETVTVTTVAVLSITT